MLRKSFRRHGNAQRRWSNTEPCQHVLEKICLGVEVVSLSSESLVVFLGYQKHLGVLILAILVIPRQHKIENCCCLTRMQ